MTRVLALPRHMSVVAEEEFMLLLHLRSLVGLSKTLRPALSFLTRNEILQEAQEVLTEEDLLQYVVFADRLARTLDGESLVAFPPPHYGATQPISAAEALAVQFLQEGSGSLWTAIREVARSLDFEEDARLLNMAILKILNTHTWTTLSIHLDDMTMPHCDRANAPGNSLLLGLTHHSGGGLWIGDGQGKHAMQIDGAMCKGTIYNTQAQAILFNARECMHGTIPWSDNRCIIVAYTIGQHRLMSPEHREFLSETGFVVPPPSHVQEAAQDEAADGSGIQQLSAQNGQQSWPVDVARLNQKRRQLRRELPLARGDGGETGAGPRLRHVQLAADVTQELVMCAVVPCVFEARDETIYTEQCQARQQFAHVVGGPRSTGEDPTEPSMGPGAAVDADAGTASRAFRFAFGERPDRSLEGLQSTRAEDVEMIDVEMMDATTGIGSAATSSAATSSTSPFTTEQHRMLLASTILANHLIEPIEVLDSEEEAAEDMLNQMD
ncbi:unnamed protein product [Symbiodinium necroappetens]|uniref:Fe2OG dioxygenase domain-containing protein n=1 Tax=Symbiodinium necroappetens TaxID=1628268 RepID=A0A813AGT4_9DINO|nr:unnamed protein product [Symbiodinium necroappetens]